MTERPRSSRQRYRTFVDDYKNKRLDDIADAAAGARPTALPKPGAPKDKKKRRKYLREYLRWLRPHRSAVSLFVVLALIVAGLQMLEPLFMRYIINNVLLGE